MRLRPGMRRGTEDLMLQVVVSGAFTTQFGAAGVWGNTMSKCIPMGLSRVKNALAFDYKFQPYELDRGA